jgi:hypothetical protein
MFVYGIGGSLMNIHFKEYQIITLEKNLSNEMHKGGNIRHFYVPY